MQPNTCGVLTETANVKINSGECNHTIQFKAVYDDDTSVEGDELYKVYAQSGFNRDY